MREIKRIYISGAITDEYDFETAFQRAEDYLRAKKEVQYRVINPAKLRMVMPEDETTKQQYMEIDLHMLGFCDEIFMLNGWEHSEGATIELKYAQMRGLKVIKQSDCGDFPE